MKTKDLLESCRNLKLTLGRNAILVAFSLFCFVVITGCGSDKTSVQLPTDFIQEFIAKHETMADKSLVYYYVKSDQPEIAEQIEVACRINKSKGVLEILENATLIFQNFR